MLAVYEGDRFWIRCDDCDRRAAVAPFPPRALTNYETDHAPTAFDRYTMGTAIRAAENVCPWCGSPLAASLVSADENWPAVDWVIRRECEHCHGWIYTRLQDLLRFHPAVITFYHERGVDILGETFWAVEGDLIDQLTVTPETDEWQTIVTLTYDGDTIELGINDELCVSAIDCITPDAV